MNPSRVLVCGGRDYDDRALVYSTLDELREERGMDLLIEGGATGADRLAGEWAEARGVNHVQVRANWREHGRRAGPMRNQLMIDLHRPTLVVAFPGRNGTLDMMKRAGVAKIPLIQVDGGRIR